jgi:hypothetical protein
MRSGTAISRRSSANTTCVLTRKLSLPDDRIGLVQALGLCTGRTSHRGSTGIALLRLCTGRTAHRGSRGIALLRLCTSCTVHRGSRGIAILRLCTGRKVHRGNRGIALLKLCTGRTAHRGSTCIALLRLCTGRTSHRGSTGIALLRLCTDRTAHRGSRGIALLFHDQRHQKGIRGQRHTPTVFTPGKARYLLYRWLGWTPGPVWTDAEISTPLGFDPRIVQPVASR